MAQQSRFAGSPFVRLFNQRKGSVHMIRNNKEARQALERQSLVGIDKYLKATTNVTILGTSYTPVQLKAVLQADLDAAAVAQTARATWQVAVEAERGTHAKAHGVLLGLKSLLVMQYGTKAADVLADFGFAPPKQTKKDPATQVAAAAKSLATRKARNTLGTQQKKAIKGTVASAPATTPAPVTPAPVATPSPVPAPAPAAGSTSSKS